MSSRAGGGRAGVSGCALTLRCSAAMRPDQAGQDLVDTGYAGLGEVSERQFGILSLSPEHQITSTLGVATSPPCHF